MEMSSLLLSGLSEETEQGRTLVGTVLTSALGSGSLCALSCAQDNYCYASVSVRICLRQKLTHIQEFECFSKKKQCVCLCVYAHIRVYLVENLNFSIGLFILNLSGFRNMNGNT